MHESIPPWEQVPFELRFRSAGWLLAGWLVALIVFFEVMPLFLGLPPRDRVDEEGRRVRRSIWAEPLPVLGKCAAGAVSALAPFLVLAVIDWRRTLEWRNDNLKRFVMHR